MKKTILTGCLILLATLFLKADISYSASGTQGVNGTVADYVAGLSANGIVSSRHNLGAFGRVLFTNNGTTQVCVFCHTPHHTNQAAAPLWNRDTSKSSNYIAYGSTIGGSNITTVDGGASIACLSCHDGVTTFDSLVNAPGNGGVVPGGSDLGWTFIMQAVDPTFYPVMGGADHFNSGLCVTCHGFTATSLQYQDTIGSLTIGTDLTNDHPVSVTYSGNSKASLRPVSTVISTIDLTTGLNNTTGNSAYYSIMTQNRWAVGGFISDTAKISDLLRNDKVECSSCHDPHFRNLSWDEIEPTYSDNSWESNTWCAGNEDCSDGLFLRRVGGNTGSGVCRTCHDK